MKRKILFLLFGIAFVAGFLSCSKSNDSAPWLIGNWSRVGEFSGSVFYQYNQIFFDTATKGRVVEGNHSATFTYSFPTITTAILDSTWRITKVSDNQIYINSANGWKTTYVKQSN